MDLTTFYAVVSATGFTLVGLWWSVIGRRPDLLSDPRSRRLAGGVYLTFLLPGLMGLFAQVGGAGSSLWRVTFGLTAVVGAWSTLRLIRADDPSATRGLFARHRWVVAALSAVVIVMGVAPGVAGAVGLTGLQGAAIAVIALIVVAHGLAWEFLTVDAPQPR